MKYPQQAYDKLKDAMYKVIKLLCPSLKLTDYTTGDKWKIYFIAVNNIMYPDSNLNVLNTNGKRIAEHGGNRLISQYEDFRELEDSDGKIIDNHIQTALNRILKELVNDNGLIIAQ